MFVRKDVKLPLTWLRNRSQRSAEIEAENHMACGVHRVEIEAPD